jgi:hypothetical protein
MGQDIKNLSKNDLKHSTTKVGPNFSANLSQASVQEKSTQTENLMSSCNPFTNNKIGVCVVGGEPPVPKVATWVFEAIKWFVAAPGPYNYLK